LFSIIVVVPVHTFFLHNAEHKDLSIKENVDKLEKCSEKEATLVLKTPQLIFYNILKIKQIYENGGNNLFVSYLKMT